MKKLFTYPARKTIVPDIVIIAIPLVVLNLVYIISDIFIVQKGRTIDVFLWTLVVCTFFAIVILIVMMINKLKVRIRIDEMGIQYNSLLKKISIKWNDILKVERQISFGSGYPRSDVPPNTYPIESELADLFNQQLPEGQLPHDLIITTRDGKRLKIMHTLRSSSKTNNGIADFENEIIEVGNIQIDEINNATVTKKEKKEWRKLLIFSIVLLLPGIVMSIIKISVVSIAFIIFGVFMLLVYLMNYISRILR